jgi:hypothetical protein
VRRLIAEGIEKFMRGLDDQTSSHRDARARLAGTAVPQRLSSR